MALLILPVFSLPLFNPGAFPGRSDRETLPSRRKKPRRLPLDDSRFIQKFGGLKPRLSAWKPWRAGREPVFMY